jgi:hypothetical protein
MKYPQSPTRLTQEAWPTPEGTPSRKPAREAEARPDPRFGRRPIKASMHAHSAGSREERVAISRPLIGRSLRRALYRFVLAVLVGVSGTLGWQSYGEQMLAAHAPTLAWLFSVSASKSPNTASSPAATASEPTQLAPLASNLDQLRRSLEQLSAKQDRMAQDIAALQAIEDDVRQKMSFTPASPAPVPPTASVLQTRPAQPKAQSSVMPSAPALRQSLPAAPAR